MAARTAKLFDENWERYDNWFETHKNIYSSELKALQKALPGGNGLEIGAGSGRFAQPLGVKVGTDPSINMLRLAKKRGVEAVQGVGEALPFKDCTFDFVLIVVTLCFVEEPEYVLREACRVLRSGGMLIVGEINKGSSWGRLYEAKRNKSNFYKIATFYSSNDIIEMFDKVEIGYLESYQTLLQPPGVFEIEEDPENGADRGGFVVIVGVKNHFSTS